MVKLAIHGGQPVTTPPPMPSHVNKEEIKAAQIVLEKGTLSSFRGGQSVRTFETEFAKYIGTKYAVATTSGTTALHSSVSALGLKPGDEVLVPAVTFVSTASVVLQEGLDVVFVDIDEFYGMDPNDLASKITSKSKAVIPVHLYGQPVDYDKIQNIAEKYGLKTIEDACQAHGAEYKAALAGNLGDVGCFSFFETKNMTCGEGGMITTNDEGVYKELLLRREHGSPRGGNTWYNYEKLGYNYNMTELQGAIGRAQLKKLDRMNNGRRENAEYYNQSLRNLDLTLPRTRDKATNVWHNYPVLLPQRYIQKRDFFVDAMRAEGIPIDVAYPKPLYDTQLFINAGIKGDCPRSDDYTSRLFTLFTDHAVTKDLIDATKKAITKIFSYLEDETNGS